MMLSDSLTSLKLNAFSEHSHRVFVYLYPVLSGRVNFFRLVLPEVRNGQIVLVTKKK